MVLLELVKQKKQLVQIILQLKHAPFLNQVLVFGVLIVKILEHLLIAQYLKVLMHIVENIIINVKAQHPQEMMLHVLIKAAQIMEVII